MYPSLSVAFSLSFALSFSAHAQLTNRIDFGPFDKELVRKTEQLAGGSWERPPGAPTPFKESDGTTCYHCHATAVARKNEIQVGRAKRLFPRKGSSTIRQKTPSRSKDSLRVERSRYSMPPITHAPEFGSRFQRWIARSLSKAAGEAPSLMRPSLVRRHIVDLEIPRIRESALGRSARH